MAEVLLFHHALGLTPGCLSFAEQLRVAGHTVHTPDVYDGVTLPDVASGVDHARRIGFDTLLERGRLSAEGLPDRLVYGGFSPGVMPAQLLAQTRPGARGALLLHAAVPLSEFGGQWPRGLPLQIHTMDRDELGDVDVAQELAATVDTAEVFLYPGDRHLFADDSLEDYDAAAAALLMQRVLDFLQAVDAAP